MKKNYLFEMILQTEKNIQLNFKDGKFNSTEKMFDERINDLFNGYAIQVNKVESKINVSDGHLDTFSIKSQSNLQPLQKSILELKPFIAAAYLKQNAEDPEM